jgi:hypothetical protein
MNCNGCVFALMDKNEEQIGCECSRIETFKNRGEAHKPADKLYYELTKFCNMYRTEEWKSKHTDCDHAAVARNEIMPLFGIAVLDDSQSSFDMLENTAMQIANIDYPLKKIKVVVSTFNARGVGKIADLINRLQKNNVNSLATFHIFNNSKFKDTEVFKKLVQATFFVSIKSGSVIPYDLFKKINRSMNDDLDRVCMWEGDGYAIINKHIADSLYLNFNNYEKMVEYIKKLAIEQNVYKTV